MADQTAPEPTMEEILASIRRIISDDDAPATEEGSTSVGEPDWSPPLPAQASPQNTGRYEEEEDVLELNEPVAAPTPSPGRMETGPSPRVSAGEGGSTHEPLVDEPVSAAAASSFGRLSAAAARPAAMAMPAPGRTLEDLTRELLRPMLKAWLDENLGVIVQQRVDEEVERIARGRVR
ncbi:MAG: DUF2497 domain-containing protein [Caulobacteraceae bacterium]